ncbi:MAG: helix-turn-helix transcriptional regulator [Gemmatimonadales bacterium]
MADNRIGGFEELVLLAVAGLQGDGYGVNIRDHLETGTNQRVSVGAVYATLDRLERKGYVMSHMGDATADRGGKRKRLFRITPNGTAAITDARRLRQIFWDAIEAPVNA